MVSTYLVQKKRLRWHALVLRHLKTEYRHDTFECGHVCTNIGTRKRWTKLVPAPEKYERTEVSTARDCSKQSCQEGEPVEMRVILVAVLRVV